MNDGSRSVRGVDWEFKLGGTASRALVHIYSRCGRRGTDSDASQRRRRGGGGAILSLERSRRKQVFDFAGASQHGMGISRKEPL